MASQEHCRTRGVGGYAKDPYPIRATIGYIDCGGGQPKVPDPQMGPLVREAFDLYASGNYSLPRLAEEMKLRGLRNRDGKPVSLNGLSTVLNNPFYTGLIRIRKTGECYTGVHAPIVSTHVFETVRRVLTGKIVPRTRRHEFSFSRMIRCSLCGQTVMAELQKGNIYYRCHTRSCDTKTIREERIEAALANEFAKLILSDEEMSYVKQWFAWARENKQTRLAEQIDARRLQLGQIRERLARLTDAYLDGTIDKALHNERRTQFLSEENSLKRQLADLASGYDDVLSRLENYLELIQAASNLRNLALPAEKRVLVKKLTSNLSVSPEKPAITLRAEAQMIAERRILLGGSPNQGVPRTWDRLLTKLSKSFEHDASLTA